jgi:streptogramin lyase
VTSCSARASASSGVRSTNQLPTNAPARHATPTSSVTSRRRATSSRAKNSPSIRAPIVGPVAVEAGGDVFYSTAQALYRLPAGRAGTPERLAVDTTLDSPHGLAVAPDGALLLADTNNGRILRIDPLGGQVTTFATLGHPRGIAVAGGGTVYVAAADEHRVVRLTRTGQRLGAVGSRFNDPYALALARDGTVYALEAGALGFIRRIGSDGASSIVRGR